MKKLIRLTKSLQTSRYNKLAGGANIIRNTNSLVLFVDVCTKGDIKISDFIDESGMSKSYANRIISSMSKDKCGFDAIIEVDSTLIKPTPCGLELWEDLEKYDLDLLEQVVTAINNLQEEVGKLKTNQNIDADRIDILEQKVGVE